MIGLVRFGRQSARVGRSALLASSVRHIHASSMMRGVDEFYDQVEGDQEGNLYTGRAWRASELRLKSFDELHQLWFVLLKEKNRLATDRAVQENQRGWSGVGRMRKVKESMARIKTVLRERTLVYQDTQRRLEERHALYKFEQEMQKLGELQQQEEVQQAEKMQ